MTFIISFSCFTGLSFTTTDDVTCSALLNYQNNFNNSNVFNTVPYIRDTDVNSHFVVKVASKAIMLLTQTNSNSLQYF